MSRPVTERQFYQLAKRRTPRGVQYWGVGALERSGSRGGYFMAGQDYSASDIADVVDWLFERANGYPKRDLPWPKVERTHYSDCEGATWRVRTPHALAYCNGAIDL